MVDDFHYLPEEARKQFIRNIKGAVFSGLRVVLLSIAHRTFDAIKAEPELTGRFASVTVPEWAEVDLRLIPESGFPALKMSCPAKIIQLLCDECQNSPFLMQKFCWEICYELGVDGLPKRTVKVPADVNMQEIFVRIAKDSGLPILSAARRWATDQKRSNDATVAQRRKRGRVRSNIVGDC